MSQTRGTLRPMFISGGFLVFILIVVLLVLLLRR